MYQVFRKQIFARYQPARQFLIDRPEALADTEELVARMCQSILRDQYDAFEADYNEASYLQPFWANYPPDDRGRSPKGDQIPWIEVGEQAIGHKLSRLLSEIAAVREVGLPAGADNRFVLRSAKLLETTRGLTDSAMLFLDIKSVGPRDEAEHTVLSPYQVSGDGIWSDPDSSLVNSKMYALGARAQHPFYPAISPIYVLKDGTIAPTVHIFIKPVYRMLRLEDPARTGQPLNRIRIVCVPNGLLLCCNPGYWKQYPGLFFPGKDDKNKPSEKMRCRVSFDVLRKIADWRVLDAKDGLFQDLELRGL